MVKNKQHFEAGQVLLVDDSKEIKKRPIITKEYPEVPLISATQAEKLRPKRELSEKQKEALKKLIENNRQRWNQAKASKQPQATIDEDDDDPDFQVPQEIPDGKQIVIVKPKQVRKPRAKPSQPLQTPQQVPVIVQKIKYLRPKRPKRPSRPKYVSDTSDTTDNDYETTDNDYDTTDNDYDDSDAEYVKPPPKARKYTKKAKEQLDILNKINEQLEKAKQAQQPQQPRLSVF